MNNNYDVNLNFCLTVKLKYDKTTLVQTFINILWVFNSFSHIIIKLHQISDWGKTINPERILVFYYLANHFVLINKKLYCTTKIIWTKDS